MIWEKKSCINVCMVISNLVISLVYLTQTQLQNKTNFGVQFCIILMTNIETIENRFDFQEQLFPEQIWLIYKMDICCVCVTLYLGTDIDFADFCVGVDHMDT